MVLLRKRARKAKDVEAMKDLARLYQNGFDDKETSTNLLPKDDCEAFKWYFRAAKLQDHEAENEVAYWYSIGRGVEKNEQLAVDYYRRAAEGGSAVAQWNLALAYMEGRGIEVNFNEGIRLMKQSAEEGKYLKAFLELGNYFHDGCKRADQILEKDLLESFKWFLMAAELGDHDAENAVGYIYETGLGIQRDSKLAVEFYERSAKGNNYTAQYNLSRCLFHGEGTAVNVSEGILWLKRSAQGGFISAMLVLGDCFREGYRRDNQTVDIDEKESLTWYEMAAKLNNHEAEYMIAVLYENGANGVENQVLKAFPYCLRAALGGHVPAQISLAKMYLSGRNPFAVKDMDKSFQWLKHAAKDGKSIEALSLLSTEHADLSSMYELGWRKLNGLDTNMDVNEGIGWLQKCAEKKSLSAIAALGMCYSTGRGIEMNFPKAMEYLTEAADCGNHDACVYIGDAYMCGVWVLQDYECAKQWYQLALELRSSSLSASSSFASFDRETIESKIQAASNGRRFIAVEYEDEEFDGEHFEQEEDSD